MRRSSKRIATDIDKTGVCEVAKEAFFVSTVLLKHVAVGRVLCVVLAARLGALSPVLRGIGQAVR